MSDVPLSMVRSSTKWMAIGRPRYRATHALAELQRRAACKCRIHSVPVDCQIAPNSDPGLACKNDPSDGAETGGAEPPIAKQSRSWRAGIVEREVMRGS